MTMLSDHGTRQGRAPQPSVLRSRPAIEDLPAWPVLLPFLGYLPAWFFGVGDLVWTVTAVVMVVLMGRVRGVRIPAVGSLWIFFLVWVLCSMIMLDSVGRVIGASYRVLQYAAATVIAVYVFNAWRTVTARYVGGAVTCFLAVATIGGYLAMAFPLFVFNTPMSHLLPASLVGNDLVADMVRIRFTQWNPDAWVVTEPRPSAPFLYANTWGNVYSVILPVAVAYLREVWSERPRRWLVLVLVVASVPPALATLNRGMFVGLGVIAAWWALQALRRGRVVPVVTGLVAAAVGVVAWRISPVSAALADRVEVTSSTQDRAALYRDTFDKTLESPLFGYGAPRPADFSWLPSLGTQGQFWMVLFSYGFIGAALFLGFFLCTVLTGVRRFDHWGVVWTAVALATVVESFYYGMATGLNISMIAAAMVLRGSREVRHGIR